MTYLDENLPKFFSELTMLFQRVLLLSESPFYNSYSNRSRLNSYKFLKLSVLVVLENNSNCETRGPATSLCSDPNVSFRILSASKYKGSACAYSLSQLRLINST